MATSSAGKAAFARELLELRIGATLVAAFENWSHVAIGAIASNSPSVTEEFLRGAVRQAVPDGYEDLILDYLNDYQVLNDAINVLTEVRDYASSKGLGKAATRRLMQAALTPDKGVFVPIPQNVLEQTLVRVPQMVPQAPPYQVPAHPDLLAPDVPLAQFGQTYRTRLLRTARTMSTAIAGREARAEAAVTKQDLRWVTMGDHRVRHEHVLAQGQTVPWDEWFRVGGIPMEYPGDPDAPIELVANCRCVLTLVDPPQRRYVQGYIPAAWLNASLTAAAPNQARAPKGTPIGGQWIDTPGGILEGMGAPAAADAPVSLEIGGSVYTGTPAPPHGREADLAARGGNTPTLLHSKGDPASSQAFQNAITAAKEGNRFGASVYVYDVADYEGMDLWVTEDGTAGVALNGNDIVSVFNAGSNPDYAGFAYHAMAQAQAAGGTRADAYDTILGNLYATAGMEVVARVPWNDDYAPDDWDYDTFAKFNGGRPDVIFLKYNPDAWFGTYTPGQGQVVDDYDEGLALTASASEPVEHREVDGVVVPRVRAGRGDRVRGGVYARHAKRALDERNAVGVGRGGHPANVHPDSGGNPSSDCLFDVPVGEGEHQRWETHAERAARTGLTAAAPGQARAPRGTPIGGQWIDTPNAVLHGLGWSDEAVESLPQAYDVPLVNPGSELPRDPVDGRAQMIEAAASTLDDAYPATSLTAEQVAALHGYTGAYAQIINGRLRGKPSPYDINGGDNALDITDDVATLDAALASQTALTDMYVYRAIDKELLPHPRNPFVDDSDPDAVVGAVIRDKAFLSTSIDPRGAGDSSMTVIRIAVPEGQPMLWAAPHSQNRDEYEVILPRDTALAITGVSYDRWGDPVYETTIATPANPSLTAAAPAQARAPKGTPIGGQWIDSPGAVLAGIGTRGDLNHGYSTVEAVTLARDKAKAKAAKLKKPTAADRRAAAERHGRSKRQGGDDRPGSKRRKQLRQQMLEEFGDGTTCPCLDCGRTLDITTVSMDRIVPGADNGRYVPQNLIPLDYDCNRARGDDPFADMAGTWATNPGSDGPVVPLGTRVRARVSGWGLDADEDADLGGADDAPSLDGVPEWVEGPLTGQAVPGYFKHTVDGYDVDPATIEQGGTP